MIHSIQCMNPSFLAFDLGATSGRVILGTLQKGRLQMRTLLQFPNAMLQIQGKFYWNIYSLYASLLEGFRQCAKEGIPLSSAGIDTWGVDFVLFGEDGTPLGLPRAYRDPYTRGMQDLFYRILPKEKVYGLTGIQLMDINSLFQLFALRKEKSPFLPLVKQLLFLPDAMGFLLTGAATCEYTIASTSQLMNATTKQLDPELLEAAGLNPEWFPEISLPGTLLGYLSEEVQSETGVGKVPIITVGGHDTASAIAAIPCENERFAYLSSGTWSLMGIEVSRPILDGMAFRLNFTNEGGVGGRIRFMKNITGLWLLEQCRKEWEKDGWLPDYESLLKSADQAEPFRSLVFPDHSSFSNPVSMTDAICNFCVKTGQKIPSEPGEFVRCIFESLVLRYRQVFEMLREMAPFSLETLHIIGGGSQNPLLNQWTADALNLPVLSGPSEATACGNLMVQALAGGWISSLEEMRKILRLSAQPTAFFPQNPSRWAAVYPRFLALVEHESEEG